MKHKSWRTWTQKEIARLEQMRLDGKKAREIAAALGRSIASVKCRLVQEGIGRVDALASRWLVILSQPHTIAGAAEAMGLTKWAVKQAKRKLRQRGYGLLTARRVGD